MHSLPIANPLFYPELTLDSMKKIIFSIGGLFLYSTGVFAQSSYTPSSFNRNDVETFVDQSGIMAFLSSSEFRTAMMVIITLTIAFWLYYIWASFQMAGEKTSSSRRRVPTPDLSTSFSRIPQLEVRRGALALAAAKHQTPEKESEEDGESLHGRGD